MKKNNIFRYLSILFILVIIISGTACKSDKTYTINYIASSGGSISGDKTQSVQRGESGTEVTALPDEYKEVKRMVIPRLRTLGTIEAEIRKSDPHSAITIHLLRVILKNHSFSGCMVGQKFIVNMDEILGFFKSREVQP